MHRAPCFFSMLCALLLAISGCQEPSYPSTSIGGIPTRPRVGQCVTYAYPQIVNGQRQAVPIEACVRSYGQWGPEWATSPASSVPPHSTPSDCAAMWTEHEQWIANTPQEYQDKEFGFRLHGYKRACGEPSEQQGHRQAELLRQSMQDYDARRSRPATAPRATASTSDQCERLRQQVVAATMIPPTMASVQFATVSALQAQFYAMGCR